MEENGRLEMFLAVNAISAAGEADIGHIIRLESVGRGIKERALRAVYGQIFADARVQAVTAQWALADRRKIAPLLAVGMQLVKTHEAPFLDGCPGTFTACTLRITCAQWQKEAEPC